MHIDLLTKDDLKELQINILKVIENFNNLDKYVSSCEACKILNCSLPQLQKLKDKRKIPFYKGAGREHLFKVSELYEYIESTKIDKI